MQWYKVKCMEKSGGVFESDLNKYIVNICFKEKKKSAKHNKVIKGVTEVLMGSSN